MFGQKSAFGGGSTGFSGFGATTSTSTFGQATQQPTSTFGQSTFGQPAQAGAGTGGLFGSTANANQSTGLFGTPQATATSFGASGFGAQTNTFGSAGTSAFKPAGSTFGATNTGFGAATTTSSGMFGQPAAGQANQSFSFGGNTQTSSAFGAAPNVSANTSFGAFGQQQQQVNGTTVKFSPPTGSDTMMKSGVQQNISTRHQCITCMKEYESKSLEELRMEDYLSNRKGPQAGGATAPGASGGLFGAPPNQTATAVSSGGLFGSTNTSQASSGGLFGQQAKPLFGSTTGNTGGFGTNTSQFGSTPGFGTNTSTAAQSGGLFGAKPGGFGAPAATTSGFSFGSNTQPGVTGGGLFGQQQNTGFGNKPFGAAQPNNASGGLFGQTAAPPAFGATNTFGQPAQAGGFGAPATSQAGTIGLFGANNQQNQAKPAFGFGASTGFGATATTSAAPSFSFGGATAQPGQSAFNNPAANKPAFGFGAPQTATSSAFGFGTQNTAATGGLFGANNAAKPTFGVGGFGTQAGTTSFGSTGGAFGSTGGAFGAPGAAGTTGGLFNSNAPKPLFGPSAPAAGGFGTGTTGFGGAGTAFGGGATNSFGFGGTQNSLGFGGTNLQMNANNMQQQAAVPNASLQSQLASLTSNPYGDNPLFKHLLPDNNRREEIMKPTNPAAQKAALNAVTYKVSPHGLKAKVKPLTGSSGKGDISVNRSGIFDGLEEDENDEPNIFVPRTSVKRLVLKPKNVPENLTVSAVADSTSQNAEKNHPDSSTTHAIMEESLNLPSVKKIMPTKTVNVEVHDESFSNLNTKRKELDDSSILTSPGDLTRASNVSLDAPEIDDEDAEPQPAGVKLRRAGYYTIPSMSELSTMVDSEGNLNVENFTIGRQGYGNIFFPGLTNIKGMNFDDIVFFRHKEVIVYPDDSNKPDLGQGLNKKAQVTLDKVWPVDKSSQSCIKSPEKLQSMSYEDKLQKACIKLGARFVEYRPETGSWVFKVDHFSKYGLDDSDEDDVIEAKKNLLEPAKKVKTLQLRSVNESNLANLSPVNLQSHTSQVEDKEENLTSPMEETFQKISTGSNRVKLMKAALFDDGEEDMDINNEENVGPPNVDITKVLKARPVILEARPTILEKRDLIEDIASSMLGVGSSNTSRGLGGFAGNESSMMGNQSMTSSLLKSQYLSMVASMKTPSKPNVSISIKKKSKAPRYTLQAGYEKQISLPNSEETEDLESKSVVPKHVDHMLPLAESMLSSSNVRLIGDYSLFMSRQFRVGWAPFWTMANPGDSLVKSKIKMAATDVVLERKDTLHLGPEIIDSFESWLEVHLENCVLSFDHEDIPKLEVQEGLNALHAHAEEASRQFSLVQDLEGVQDIKQVLDLMIALWGRLRPVRQMDDDDVIEDMDQTGPNTDTHKTTMDRKQALTSWLERVTSESVRKDIETSRNSGDHLKEILALLSGNKRLEACDRAQDKSDHYLASMISMASGPNLTFGQLLANQLERWQEARADKFIKAERLKLYSLISGTPVWPGSEDTVNTCDDLDWLRAFGLHLWYFTSPAASISDALNLFEEAFQKDTSQFGAYAQPPRPGYAQNGPVSDDLLFDIRFHLLKLYSSKAHKIEAIVVPKSYSENPLDYKLGWLVAELLASLGYTHMARRDMMHMDFAAQLESMGLWHWSIFVLLHLEDSQKRAKLCRDVLGRNVLPSDDESTEREVFLQDRLSVPQAWIAEAKAVRAATDCNYGDQAWYLLRAENWNEAHEVIVKQIAPDSIINEDYEFFLSLLEELASHESRVANWQTQGQVFYDFINVELKIRQLLDKRDEQNIGYDIQTLKPRVMSLCSRVKSLPVTCAKERLCQSEIAKKMAHLTRVVLELENNESQSEILAQNLAQLPLPDDYMLQELRTINRIHLKELLAARTAVK